jgi:hypothetical protein
MLGGIDRHAVVYRGKARQRLWMRLGGKKRRHKELDDNRDDETEPSSARPHSHLGMMLPKPVLCQTELDADQVCHAARDALISGISYISWSNNSEA